VKASERMTMDWKRFVKEISYKSGVKGRVSEMVTEVIDSDVK